MWCRFSPGIKILNYSGSKETREEERTKVINHVTSQGREWNRAKFPFHVLLAHYEVEHFILNHQFLTSSRCYLLGGDQRHGFLAEVPMALFDCGRRPQTEEPIICPLQGSKGGVLVSNNKFV